MWNDIVLGGSPGMFWSPPRQRCGRASAADSSPRALQPLTDVNSQMTASSTPVKQVTIISSPLATPEPHASTRQRPLCVVKQSTIEELHQILGSDAAPPTTLASDSLFDESAPAVSSNVATFDSLFESAALAEEARAKALVDQCISNADAAWEDHKVVVQQEAKAVLADANHVMETAVTEVLLAQASMLGSEQHTARQVPLMASVVEPSSLEGYRVALQPESAESLKQLDMLSPLSCDEEVDSDEDDDYEEGTVLEQAEAQKLYEAFLDECAAPAADSTSSAESSPASSPTTLQAQDEICAPPYQPRSQHLNCLLSWLTLGHGP